MYKFCIFISTLRCTLRDSTCIIKRMMTKYFQIGFIGPVKITAVRFISKRLKAVIKQMLMKLQSSILFIGVRRPDIWCWAILYLNLYFRSFLLKSLHNILAWNLVLNKKRQVLLEDKPILDRGYFSQNLINHHIFCILVLHRIKTFIFRCVPRRRYAFER